MQHNSLKSAPVSLPAYMRRLTAFLRCETTPIAALTDMCKTLFVLFEKVDVTNTKSRMNCRYSAKALLLLSEKW